jgi:indolepyruvate ferredoxin oxidoreductase, beta subunit
MENKVTNILFYGIGGQGILKVAEVCGWAAIFDGWHAKKSEVHGMAQRGGSVESHVRFGNKVYSPLIPKGEADFLVCLYKPEHGRLKDFLKKGGKDLTGYLDEAAAAVKDKRYLNTYILGVLSKDLEISEASWMKSFEKLFTGKMLEENKRIFLSARGKKP